MAVNVPVRLIDNEVVKDCELLDERLSVRDWLRVVDRECVLLMLFVPVSESVVD